jgi:hypothetical protein
MLKLLSLIAMAAGLVLAVGYADQSKGKLLIPVEKTSPTDCRQMFNSYCAPRHGVDGPGNGPAAPAVKTPPVDLTTLARRLGNLSRHIEKIQVKVEDQGSAALAEQASIQRLSREYCQQTSSAPGGSPASCLAFFSEH